MHHGSLRVIRNSHRRIGFGRTTKITYHHQTHSLDYIFGRTEQHPRLLRILNRTCSKTDKEDTEEKERLPVNKTAKETEPPAPSGSDKRTAAPRYIPIRFIHAPQHQELHLLCPRFPGCGSLQGTTIMTRSRLRFPIRRDIFSGIKIPASFILIRRKVNWGIGLRCVLTSPRSSDLV